MAVDQINAADVVHPEKGAATLVFGLTTGPEHASHSKLKVVLKNLVKMLWEPMPRVIPNGDPHYRTKQRLVQDLWIPSAAAVLTSDDFEQVAVRVFEVDTASAVVVIDLS